MATHPRANELTAAFHDFNRLSSSLESSYRDLESRVATLAAELAEARRERYAELENRARLAARLEDLLALLPGGVLVTDGNGLVTEANRATGRLFGVEPVGLPLAELMARLGAGAGDGEYTTPAGLKVSVSRRALPSDGGEILLVADVSDNARQRAWLERQSRLSTLGEAAALLAHQVRTPLAAALLYTNRLANPDIAAEERASVAAKVVGRLKHLEAQVADMLAYARGGGGSFVACDVNLLLEQVAQSLASKLLDGASLTVRTHVTAVRVQANPEALVGALVNLAANGLEAGGERAEVLIEALADGERLVFRIVDNGPGVPAELRERIFEPFFTTRSHGTGLGLAVVRSVARAHGGEVSIEDSTHGAAFRIDLPLCKETP
jgi:two-component system, sensor histidine kinase FlrB